MVLGPRCPDTDVVDHRLIFILFSFSSKLGIKINRHASENVHIDILVNDNLIN